jgi:DsbC/DsbD-like thiol-disulfide interchange protein
MITRREAFLSAAGAGLVAATFWSRRTVAEDRSAAASPWAIGLGARMRLLRGAPLANKETFAAGIEIALEPGFKTYWRMPGSAGIPPVFDWSSSRNLAAVSPDWPAPRRFDEAGISVIGYAGDNIVLPLRIAPTDPHAPVELSLSLAYAACKAICVPEKGDVALLLAPDMPRGLYSALIEAAAREIPKRVAPVELELDRPQAARLSLASSDPSLALSLRLGTKEQVLDIFVEGPRDWLFGAPRPLANSASGEVRLPLLDHPKWVDRAADIPFTLTILTDMRALETQIGARAAG